MQFGVDNSSWRETLDVLSILEFIDEGNPHEAAHVLLSFNRRSNKFPELEALRPALLTLAGEQSLNQGEIGCAAEFWQRLQREQPFEPQLAVNLVKVLDLNEDYQELQRLLTRLIKWLEQDFKQHPQNWPEDRRKLTIVYAHCRLADTWMAIGRGRAALGELQLAERIDPRSPEVVGRRGLVAVTENQYDEATQLLTQALEGGCQSAEVYTTLVETWKTLGNPQAATETRRRFGKKFGDHLSTEAETKVLPWIDALSTRSYPFFRRLVQAGSDSDPAMRACQIFVEAVQGEPTSGGKVVLDQKQAVKAWDDLLQGLSLQEQVQTMQAIALSILLFTKREKGIAALITQYMDKLLSLGDQPEARAAYLLVLALKERDPKKLQVPFQSYLGAQPQPGNALAQIQLQLRCYTQAAQAQMLRSLLQESLKREPQNPLLLLASATTYPDHSPQYEKLKQESFEIARRLQDARALQAFRAEEAFLNAQEAQQFLPDPDTFDSMDMNDMDSLLESMISRMFGGKIPPNELRRMMPELKQMMMNDMPDFEEEEEEEESSGFGFPFGGFSPNAKKSSKRRR
jgi:tetratricopeptide (TPR) repeat protein